MANTYYDSRLTAEQIEAALRAISGVIAPANNGKILAIQNGVIVPKSVTDYLDINLQSKTVTPSASQQTVAPDSGYDGLSEVVVNGDADLVAGNIKKDVNIFGVTGSYEGSAPSLQSKSVTPEASQQTVQPDSGYDGLSSVVVAGDADLVAGNIKKNVSIFGVVGSYEGGGGGGGATILSGKSDPTSSIGSDGNIYLKYVDGSDVFGTPSSNTPDGANISATSVYSSYAAYKAFGKQDGWGASGGEGTLSFTFDSDQYKINQLQFEDSFVVSGGYLQAKNFSFEGSNDGTNWEVLYSQSNAQTSADIKTVTINTNNYYRYFRFVVNSGGGYCGLRRISAVGEKYGTPVNSALIVDVFLKVNGAWQDLIGSDMSDVGGL